MDLYQTEMQSTVEPARRRSNRSLGRRKRRRSDAVEPKVEPTAGLDRKRRNDASGDDDHSGGERTAVLDRQIGYPGKRCQRIVGKAAVTFTSVDLQPAGDPG